MLWNASQNIHLFEVRKPSKLFKTLWSTMNFFMVTFVFFAVPPSPILTASMKVFPSSYPMFPPPPPKSNLLVLNIDPVTLICYSYDCFHNYGVLPRDLQSTPQ